VTLAAETINGMDLKTRDPVENDGNGGIKVSVMDTGIGIEEEDFERIFYPFEQADNSASRKYQGTGLGLSLTRRLVELHGGKIWALSQGRDMGATISFILPI
jgi:signal transduction histidine kinase